jgi:hypothetical protein
MAIFIATYCDFLSRVFLKEGLDLIFKNAEIAFILTFVSSWKQIPRSGKDK